MIIKNAMVFTLEKGFIQKDIFIDKGYFSDHSSDGGILDAQGGYLIPGLIDIHFHGCTGYDFCDGTAEAIEKIAEYQLQKGITSICPATMTLPEDKLSAVCKNAADYLTSRPAKKGARLCGIHLEGPFISPAKKGAQNPSYIQDPDMDMFLRLQKAAGGLIKIITLAPELKNAMDFIERLSPFIRISLGHTACDYETALQAFHKGAGQITHLFNAMPGFAHRHPGPAGAAFDSKEVMAELIGDGIHISPSAFRGAFQLFGSHRIILISDSMMAAGMKDGIYTLGGQSVTVKKHLAALEDGTIAGSVTNLMDCLLNAVDMGIPLEAAVRCATFNPAKAIGIHSQYGSIGNGKTADCLLLDKDTLSLRKILLKGEEI